MSYRIHPTLQLEKKMKRLLLIVAAVFAFALSAHAAVDLNTASQTELETVKGIGPKKAQAIIEYRKKNGPFKSADDLDKVPGFGKKSVDMMKKDITVGNAQAAASGKMAEVKEMKDAKVAKVKDVSTKK